MEQLSAAFILWTYIRTEYLLLILIGLPVILRIFATFVSLCRRISEL